MTLNVARPVRNCKVHFHLENVRLDSAVTKNIHYNLLCLPMHIICPSENVVISYICDSIVMF